MLVFFKRDMVEAFTSEDRMLLLTDGDLDCHILMSVNKTRLVIFLCQLTQLAWVDYDI